MGKYLFGAIVSLLFLPATSKATSYNYTGTINKIVSIPGQDNRDYILVNGFATAGSCLSTSGKVVAKIPSNINANRMFSLALSAEMADKKVLIVVDDSVKNFEGHCFIVALETVE